MVASLDCPRLVIGRLVQGCVDAKPQPLAVRRRRLGNQREFHPVVITIPAVFCRYSRRSRVSNLGKRLESQRELAVEVDLDLLLPVPRVEGEEAELDAYGACRGSEGVRMCEPERRVETDIRLLVSSRAPVSETKDRFRI